MKPQRITKPMEMILSLVTCPPWLTRNIALYQASLCIQKPFFLPLHESLWQTPKFNLFPTDGQKVWYGPGKVGHNSDNFMTKLAKSCGFQQKGYTNHHSLRASGITTLKRNNYNDKQIMSITGHRSLQVQVWLSFKTWLQMKNSEWDAYLVMLLQVIQAA